jgi:hypothetical protein
MITMHAVLFTQKRDSDAAGRKQPDGARKINAGPEARRGAFGWMAEE